MLLCNYSADQISIYFQPLQPLFLSVLEKQEALYGGEHNDTLSTAGSVACVFYMQENYDLAEPLFVRVLDTRKRVFGNDHPDTLASMNNLASLYMKQGYYEKAEPLYISCLESSKILVGKN